MVNKRFPGKVTQLLALDKQVWNEFKELREPYGTINEMFEDFVRIMLGQEPEHKAILERLKEVLPGLVDKS